MSLVVLPIAVVNIAIGVDQSASAISFIIFPVAFVQGAVNPDLHTFAIFAVLAVPLTFILGPVVQSHHWLLGSLCLGVALWRGLIVE